MKTSISRTVSGILIVIVGLVLLLANLQVFDFGQILSNWWPMIIIIIGLIIFVNNTHNYLWAILSVVFGVLLQLRELDIVTFNVFQLFWPAIIVIVGVSLLMNRSWGGKNISKEASDEVTAILGGVDHKNSSDNYLGGKATAVLGGVKIDLRKATIKKEATISVFAVMSGIELWVPEGVVVKSRASVILGGIENKTVADGKSAPVLYIAGDLFMAGIEVKN